MMVELEERYRRLIHQLEQENCRNYRIVNIKDSYYINIEDLLDALDDTQDNREYAEEKFKEYINKTEERKEENTPGLLNSYQKECEKLKEEKEKLIAIVEAIQNTLSEDDYEKLAKEGVELFERD